MPTFRDKVADFLRQLSSGSDKNSDSGPTCTSPTSGTFIQKYLNGEVKKTHPDILCGKSCYDLPVRGIAPLSRKVVAAYTGPNGGLVEVNRRSKAIDFPDADVDFIDEDYNSSSENIQQRLHHVDNRDHSLQGEGSSERKKSEDLTNSNGIRENGTSNKNLVNGLTDDADDDDEEEVAGIKNWKCPHDNAYGVATTLYECHPVTKENAGEPIADCFAICMRENSAIMCLADGVNWGEKSCLAARCAVHGCMDYLNKALYHESGKVETTMDIFVCLLRSFHAAHNLILQENGMLTTLCAAVVCQLQGTNKFIVCTCNVGDSLAYVYSHQYGVREITQGSHDIYSMRDMRDALGALGPVDGQNPELNNLTVAMTTVEPGDVVFLTSDGVSDNFDPVVGKFAIPKKAHKNDPAKQSSSSSEPKTENQRNHPKPKRMNSQGQDKEPSTPEFVLPMVEAHQRHELTLLRMEDLLNNGVNEGDEPCESARQLCCEMIDFATKLTVAKRRILEDPDLYVEGESAVSQNEQRMRRRRVGEKLAMVPGKLDHASVVAYKVGLYDHNQELSTTSKAIPRRQLLHTTSIPCETPTYERDRSLAGTPLSSSAPVQYSLAERMASTNPTNSSAAPSHHKSHSTSVPPKAERKSVASRPKSLFRSSSMTNPRPFAALKQNIKRISTPTQNFRGILTPTEGRLSSSCKSSRASTPTQCYQPNKPPKSQTTSSAKNNSTTSCFNIHSTKSHLSMTNGNGSGVTSLMTNGNQPHTSSHKAAHKAVNDESLLNDCDLLNLESRI